MKRLALLLILATTGYAAADIRVFRWQESRDAKTGEKRFGFFIAPRAVQIILEADARSDQKTVEALAAKLPKDAWDYGLLLSGRSNVYQKEKIALFEPSPCGVLPEIASGTVEVDWMKSVVRIALKVVLDGKVVDFVGNGIYPFKKGPNQVAQTTPGSCAPLRV